VRLRSRNVHDVYSAWAETDNHTVSSTVAYFTGGVTGRSFGKSLLGNGGFESNVSLTPLNTDIAVGGNVSDEWYAHVLDSFAPQIDTAAPRSGAQCLLLHALGVTVVPASSTHGSRVFTKILIPIKQGDIVRVNGFVRADFSGSPNAGISLQAVVGFFLIAADGVTLLQEQFGSRAGITGAIGYTKVDASLLVPAVAGGQSPAYIRVQCTALVVNANGSPTAIGNDCGLRFDDIQAVLQSTAFDLTPINTASTAIGSNPLTAPVPLTSTTAIINVAAATFQFGDGQISYNSGSITNLLSSTLYYVYAKDPTYSGGTVAFLATTDNSVVTGDNGNVFFGFITTPAVGAGAPTGGKGDGTGPCFTLNTHIVGEHGPYALGEHVDGNRVLVISRVNGVPRMVLRKANLLVHDYAGELIDMGADEGATPPHRFRLGDLWKRAEEVFVGAVRYWFEGRVGNLAIETEEEEERNYMLGNGWNVHNVRKQ
jgi:hypothetical protein